MLSLNDFGLLCGGRKRMFLRCLENVGILMSVLVAGGRSAPAAICFLPDCVDSVKLEFSSEADGCLAAGYQRIDSLICPSYSNIEYCPDNSSYIKCNSRQWCLDHGYTETECSIPEYLYSRCPNGEEIYLECRIDYERACKEENPVYVDVCPDGWKLDRSELCSYSEKYGECCNLCADYPYRDGDFDEDWGYVRGEGCESCGGEMRYKREIRPCEGYQKCTVSPKSGTAECRHGSEVWYKECCAYDCGLAECPEGTDCDLEVCSNKYCIKGCLVNYTDYCKRPEINCWALGYTATSCEKRKLVCPYNDKLYFCM